MRQALLAAAVVLVPLLASTPAVAAPTRDRIRVAESDVQIGHFAATAAARAANTRTIFLNRCVGGCQVTTGQTDSRTNRSSIADTGRLGAFSRGDTVWDNVVACMRDVFAQTGSDVDIVTTDPGNVPHFEIMIGGTPGQLGFNQNTGGVSPWTCAGDYIQNSLVFVFDVWGSNVEDICSTAAQEVAHSWHLDHVTLASDPLTYFGFNGRRYYRDQAAQCGSDCVNGQSPFGATCTGANQQTHPCDCTGAATQNSISTIRALFGTGVPTPPNISIIRPTANQVLNPGFPVEVTLEDENGINLVELLIDGAVVATKTTLPYVFAAPTTIAAGTHTLAIRATDGFDAAATQEVPFVIATACTIPSDCPLDTDTCIDGRCMPGAGVQGGLGSVCVDATSCASGECASDNAGNRYCTVACDPSNSGCPADFECLDAGSTGVCWPTNAASEDTDDGGCSTSGGGAPLMLGLGALFLLGRRRPAA